ncbi:MAG: GNAT family N-acetyltransferase [Alphaproteobacteria bacterium]|nr:GNAT family N-acetyltransferase [Alphaproteobacteria bacterium]
MDPPDDVPAPGSAPRGTEDSATLRDGTRLRLRDIGPADAPLLHDFFHHMSGADARLRFFVPLRELSPALTFRLSHPDPARDIAIAALPEFDEHFLGVVRLAGDPRGCRGEYAIAVRTDMKGHGIGYLLLGRLLARARAKGIALVWGDVMRENDAMLQMAREHGFATADHPQDATLVRVRKML